MRVETRLLGRTGLVVSRLGLGLAALGRPGYLNLGHAAQLPPARTPEALAARTAEMLETAAAAGVRYLDAARSYGRAEEFLAAWLAARRPAPGTLTIGSKWGYRYTAGWRVDAPVHEEKELTLARFTAQLAETRALLGDRLDLYQIHSATAESGCLEDAALLAALVAGRRAGAYRAVGLTLSGPGSARTLELARGARAGGERVFDVVQATCNVLEPSLAGPLARAHADGMGVIVKEALANGRLTPANTRPADAALVATLAAAARAAGCGMDQLALAFVLGQPWADVVLSGAATTAHLTSHLGALGVRPDPDALASLAEAPEAYWATRAGLAWN